MFLLKSFFIFLFIFLSLKNLKAENSLEDRFLKQKEALFQDYLPLVQKIYKDQKIHLEALSGDLSPEEFLRQNYDIAFNELAKSLRDYELLKWKIEKYLLPVDPVRYVWFRPLKTIVQKQMQEEREKKGGPDEYHQGAWERHKLENSGKELSFFLDHLENYSKENKSKENSKKSNFLSKITHLFFDPNVFSSVKYLEADYFSLFHAVDDYLRQHENTSLIEILHEKASSESVVFTLLAPSYHLAFQAASTASFERLVINLLVLEKSPVFDLYRKHLGARNSSILHLLVEAFFSPLASEAEARDAFLGIRAFNYFFTKKHPYKLYKSRDDNWQTALMRGVFLAESALRREAYAIHVQQKYKNRFHQIFNFMLEEKSLRPSYMEIRYASKKLPFLRDVIYESLERQSRFKHVLFDFETRASHKMRGLKTNIKEFSLKLSSSLRFKK